ncbi:MAG: hypothetical protein HY581_10055 [Nitrospirae bacterium]|nr:hypothetical protein [Nitrospirota bacterium]
MRERETALIEEEIGETAMVDSRVMTHLVAIIMACATWYSFGTDAWALEFSADQITRVNGHSRKANLYYRDEMWRLEHHDVGPVNVTIVRKDKQVMWLLLSRMKHFKTVPYDPEQAPKVSERLDGEVAREEIGTETLDGHPTTLYQVTVQKGERTDIYYQWLATDIRFPLKLAKKDGSWIVEYRNVKLRAMSDFLFQLPVNFQPLEEFDQTPKTEKKGQPM